MQILQILQSTKNQGRYFLWCRFGRVGAQGQSVKTWFNDPKEAVTTFEQKFYDKTVKGDYREIDMGFSVREKEKEEEKIAGEEKEAGKSELPEQVQELMKLIFDEKMMSDQLKTFDYDPRKMPLGKLPRIAIQKGYEILSKLADAIEKKSSVNVLNTLASEFYSYIPHDFGYAKMSELAINTDEKVKKKLEMLSSLQEMQKAIHILSKDKTNAEESVLNASYKKLKCSLTPCEKDSDEFKMVVDYIKNSHATTHSMYSLELQDLFSVDREGEAERFTRDLHNKQLLWYGSRLTNYAGILSEGLEIPNLEAPLTGYIFGKGVYFTDMVSKAGNYCFTSRENNTGIMLLCEVALGDCNEKLHADSHAAELPPGKHSTKGLGRFAPHADGARIIDGDVVVPMGKLESTGVQGGAFLYNEYVVYDVKQIKIRYLLKVKFNYRFNY